MTDAIPKRRPFSTAERWLIIGQVVIAVVLGVIAFIDSNDPDWGGLVRLVVLMMLVLWLGAIALTAVIAWYLQSPVARVLALVFLPFALFVVAMLALRAG
ncbi:MAG: hypothetical protein KDB69_05735 [Acidimicrobiia bacterium]|nr:hypothetical protein [Acidimicrobiia bacterium]